MGTPLDPSPTEHWNRVYRHREPAVLPEDDGLARCALRHFGGVDGGRADRELAWIDDQLSRFERLRRLSYLQHVLLTAPL